MRASARQNGRRYRLALLAAVAALALGACAQLPGFPAARVAKPADAYASEKTFSSAPSPTTSGPTASGPTTSGATTSGATTSGVPAASAATPASWPSDAWWRRYGDPQLDALIEEALAGSPTFAAAEARVRKADALAALAGAPLAPSVSASGGVEEMKQSYNAGIPPAFVPQGYNDAGALTLNFNYEFDFWGRNRAALAAATSQARAAQADAAEAHLMLSTAVATAYADLSRLYAQRDVAARAQAVRTETADIVRRRVDAGLDTRGELNQALAGPHEAAAQLAAIDETIAQRRNAVAALLGEGPDRGLAIARPAGATLKPFGLPPHLAADLLGRRPDIVAARWRAEAAHATIDQARASFYPNVNLVAFVGLQALPLDKLFASGSDIGQGQLAFSLPIFEGGRLRANYRGAQADRDAAVAAYDEAVTQALHDVADVTVSERALTTRLTESKAALAADEEAFRIARLRYKGGLNTYQATLLAEQAVLSERAIVADLEARAFVLDVALVRALGGGFSSS
jgi:NodT family efflux transporter outer membrane factor (OMF) lipoprotein